MIHNCSNMLMIFSILLINLSRSLSLNPVLLVPGYMGSQLEADLNKTSSTHWWCMSGGQNVSLWFDPLSLMPLAFNCWKENVRLHFDHMSGKSRDAEGVRVRERGFGDPSSVRFTSVLPYPFSQVFNSLINSLVKLGYREKEDLVAAPYDWRRAPHESGSWLIKFEELVEKSYKGNGGLPVIIICHSYGCPFVHYFLTERLQEGWKNRYVRGLIGIAGAWAGNFHALYKYLSDEPHDLLSKLVPGIMKIERTFTSNISLLPRANVWKGETLIRTKQRNYTANDVQELLYASNNDGPWFPALNHISKSWNRFPAPGIDTHCISGKGIPTRAALVTDTDFWDPDAGVVRVERADGDGCLLLRTQSSCQVWKEETESDGHEFSYREMNLNHMQLIQDNEAIDYVITLIRSMSGRGRGE